MTPVASPQPHARTTPSAAHHGTPGDAPALSPAELEQRRTEDKHAAAAIVGIIVAIFTIAFVMYMVICFLALGGG